MHLYVDTVENETFEVDSASYCRRVGSVPDPDRLALCSERPSNDIAVECQFRRSSHQCQDSSARASP